MLNPNFPFTSVEARQEFERRTAELGRQVQTTAEALTTAFTPIVQRCFATVQPLLDWANSPEGRAVLATYETHSQLTACHCLCGHNHPGRPLCLGEVPAGELATVTYRTREHGAQDVTMCRPCADVALAKVRA